MHTSELCYYGFNQAKPTYTRRGMVAAHFHDHDNTLAVHSKFSFNHYISFHRLYENISVTIMKLSTFTISQHESLLEKSKANKITKI